ncbi:MAG: GNAT family N-acetyltransferase [Actinobacteria bacterium]|nr:GNAT family N-acetyltransferase [Actinomycetota bacterium]
MTTPPPPGVPGAPPDLPDGWRLVIVDRGPLQRQAARLEYEVFFAEGFCASSGSGQVREYEPWAGASTFHVVVDAGHEPVGVVRTIIGALDDVPAGHLERHGRPLADPVCEYASLAVAPHARKTGIAEALYRSVWTHARCSGATGLVAIVEPWLQALLRDHYGFPFEAFGPLVWYMGGEVMPIAVDLATVESAVSETRPELWAWLTGPERPSPRLGQAPFPGLAGARPSERETGPAVSVGA